MSSISGDFVIIDDHNPSIDYLNQSLWLQLSSPGGGVQAIDGTVTSGTTGAKATFTFTGTDIQVVGITASSIPASSNATVPSVQFSLDGTPTVVQPPKPSIGGSSIVDQSFSYYVQENLSADAHTLDIDVLDASDEYSFILDAIVYQPSGTSVPSSALVSTSIPVPTGGNASGSSSSSKAAAPVGAIVGGVIGGLAVLIGAAIAGYFFCFKRRNSRPYFYATSAKPEDLLDEETKPTPFQNPAPSIAHPASVAGGSQYQPGAQSTYSETSYHIPSLPNFNAPQVAPTAPSAYSASTSEGPAVSGYSGGSSAARSQSSTLQLVGGSARPTHSSPNQLNSKAAEAGLLSVGEGQPHFHADSGVRFNSSGEPSSSAHVLTDVPPSYSEN